MTPRRAGVPLLALALLAGPVLAACGSGDAEESAADLLARARTTLDDTPSLHFVLASEGAPATGQREISGITWTEHDQRAAEDPGNLAYVLTTEHGASTVVIAGTAGDAELQTFAEAVSAQLAAGE